MVAVLSQKGDVGKTTPDTSLAVAAETAGISVAITDLVIIDSAAVQREFAYAAVSDFVLTKPAVFDIKSMTGTIIQSHDDRWRNISQMQNRGGG